MRSLILASLLTSCGGPAIQARHIAATGLRPCLETPFTVICSTNLPESGCRQLIRAMRWVNGQLPGAFVYGGQRDLLPGKAPTAMNLVVVGYGHVQERLDKTQAFMETRMLPDRSSGCVVWTFIEVRLSLDDFSDDRVNLAFAHELLHVMGVNHTHTDGMTMSPASGDYVGDPTVDEELRDTLNALYPNRGAGILH
jgi:hypothetical protein